MKKEATGKQTPGLGRWLVQRYLIDGMSGMAMGLFCTLIVGLILKQIGSLIGDNPVGYVFLQVGTIANYGDRLRYRSGNGRQPESAEARHVFGGSRGFPGGLCLTACGRNTARRWENDPVRPGGSLGGFSWAALAGMEIGRLVSGKPRWISLSHRW